MYGTFSFVSCRETMKGMLVHQKMIFGMALDHSLGPLLRPSLGPSWALIGSFSRALIGRIYGALEGPAGGRYPRAPHVRRGLLHGQAVMRCLLGTT